MEKRFFATDCEGPISINDNAMEMAADFLPRGDLFFARVSKYDDFLADVEKRPGYRAGDTLKLILPFFKAFDVTEKAMALFSRNHILLLPQARETLSFIASLLPCYIISTSYRPYIQALCRAIGHPEQNSFSTPVPLDTYPLKTGEKERLKNLAEEIAGFPEFDWPDSAAGPADLSEKTRAIIGRLNRIFWGEIAAMDIGRLLNDIQPVGGEEKAAAFRQIASTLNQPLANGFYVGDSITDVQVFRQVNQAGGVTLSFNGNAYAVREARLAVLSPTTLPIAVLAQAFHREGLSGVFSLAGDWSREKLLQFGVNPSWVEVLFPEDAPPQAVSFILNEANRSEIGKRSSEYRKQVRGEVIGALG